ncbi:LytR C-terminal domain-containing protein [Bifidobacterium leontopitheci]|uniref:LytR cell envelope-related transcriptional attenuator n=1 Tax=Bifidobacterium leontopitheci TaxID=2650774 RepID=A0A6I1GJ09_9BIFI|nr:LytR C-terminal domain-containing protein [Bifidobacterium leontopitheci]KAB7789616.1 LytR cell envelope-related transcriptional attenuator [Bifidobacterium leontopitheci]
MTQQYDERAERKRYIRRRQQFVFSIVGAIMAVVLVVSMLFYFHVGGLGVSATAAVKPNYGVRVPCSVKDASKKNQKYTNYANVKVRVLNGTDSAGFARAVGQALQNRQFSVVGFANYKSTKVERTTIYFGKNAINDAYTLNTNFTDAVMVMDDRKDKLVDVVIGATFNNLTDQDELPSGDESIKDFDGCVSADAMGALPKAIDHTEVN